MLCLKKLTGKVAVVTGASRGIGKQIAIELAKDGAFVVVHYGTRKKAATEAVQQIVEAGGNAIAIGAKLGTVESVKQFLQELDIELLRLTGTENFDILVNNADIGRSSTLIDTSEEEFDELFAVNVKVPFFLVQQSIERINDGGRIINISSGVTRIAFPQIMAYNLTKGAINTFTLHLAQLLGERNITVNAVLPGITDTDVNANWLHTTEGEQFAKDSSVFGRVGETKDIADAVHFLATDEARWITAHLLDATGGSNL